MTTVELSVRFRDCDAYQHVNNAAYLTYLEEARAAWFAALTGAEPRTDSFPFILAAAHVEYLSPATFGDRLRVEVRVGAVRSKSWELHYMVSAGDRVVARAMTVQVAYDYQAGRSVFLPDSLRPQLEAMADERGASSSGA